MSIGDYKNFAGKIAGKVDNIKPVKKLGGAILIFVLLAAVIFDIIGIIPGMSSVMFLLFIGIIKVQLWFAGYHTGIIGMIASFMTNATLDLLLPPWFACTFFTLTFYYFNNRLYKAQQKLLENSPEHKLA